MSYKDFLRSTSNPMERPNPTSSSQTIHRKPPANYTTIPITTSPGSVHKTVTQYNNLRSASMSSSQGPSISPIASVPSRSYSPAPTASPIIAKASVEPTSTSVPVSVPVSVPTTASSRSSPPPPFSSQPAAPEIADFPAPVTNGVDHVPKPQSEWDKALKRCLILQTEATIIHRKRPFAALLLGPDKFTVLQTQLSISHIQHAESELARSAASQYSQDYLRKCTLVSTWEPCAMCAGAIYWSGIGRVVYGASETKLRDLTGPGNLENMTMSLPCRTVFAAGQIHVDVVGPVPGWEDKVFEESNKWWREHRSSAVMPLMSSSHVYTNGVTHNGRSASNSLRSVSVVTNPMPDEGVSSRIGEDGEYKADLKVDWMF